MICIRSMFWRAVDWNCTPLMSVVTRDAVNTVAGTRITHLNLFFCCVLPGGLCKKTPPVCSRRYLQTRLSHPTCLCARSGVFKVPVTKTHPRLLYPCATRCCNATKAFKGILCFICCTSTVYKNIPEWASRCATAF